MLQNRNAGLMLLGSTILLLVAVPAAMGDRIEFNFGMGGGAGDQDTLYSYDSAAAHVPLIPNAAGRLVASLTLTDGDGDGATLTGLPEAVQVFYNGNLYFGGVFSEVTAPPGGVTEITAAFPAHGFALFLFPPDSVSFHVNFMLSAHDSFSLDCGFTIMTIPEPTGVFLLVVVGAFARRMWR